MPSVSALESVAFLSPPCLLWCKCVHTQRGPPLYAVLSPHWIKVVGYKQDFVLGLLQSRVTDRPESCTKHSIEVIAVGRYNYLRLILTQIYHLLLL